jgi:hypothetical protein
MGSGAKFGVGWNLHDTRPGATAAKRHGECAVGGLPSAGNQLIRKDRLGRIAAVHMPSLIRFLAVVLILAGLAFAGLWALANLVEPQQRDMSITVQPEKSGR